MREIKFRGWDDKELKMYHFKPNWIDESICEGNCLLMQFTGLQDKNGIDIYEGDLLKHHGIVAWNDVELMWSRIDLNWNDRREWHNLESLTSPLEIIGNIYQNPELIET